jgi:hypothetical protein
MSDTVYGTEEVKKLSSMIEFFKNNTKSPILKNNRQNVLNTLRSKLFKIIENTEQYRNNKEKLITYKSIRKPAHNSKINIIKKYKQAEKEINTLKKKMGNTIYGHVMKNVIDITSIKNIITEINEIHEGIHKLKFPTGGVFSKDIYPLHIIEEKAKNPSGKDYIYANDFIMAYNSFKEKSEKITLQKNIKFSDLKSLHEVIDILMLKLDILYTRVYIRGYIETVVKEFDEIEENEGMQDKYITAIKNIFETHKTNIEKIRTINIEKIKEIYKKLQNSVGDMAFSKPEMPKYLTEKLFKLDFKYRSSFLLYNFLYNTLKSLNIMISNTPQDSRITHKTNTINLDLYRAMFEKNANTLSNSTNSNSTNSNRPRSNSTNSNRTISNRTRSNSTNSNRTISNRTRSNSTNSNRTITNNSSNNTHSNNFSNKTRVPRNIPPITPGMHPPRRRIIVEKPIG